MGLEKVLNLCLASQQIREHIKNGKIVTSTLDESRIQPSSFEPSIGNELFILDTESGLFRPNERETVYRTLLQLPKRRRQKVDISGGFELKKGFTYLAPLEEKVRLDEHEWIKSSPKSSFGRLFLDSRLIGDNNQCFNEVKGTQNNEISLWLLVQPLAFNVIAYPGLSLNQLRFFSGYEAQLRASELIDEFRKNPLLHKIDKSGSFLPADPVVTEGLEIHLDLSGM